MAFLDILSGGIELPNIELFTKKEQKTSTSSYSSSSVYSPTINRTYDIQYNIASGESSSISTKKEQAISQTPQTSATSTPFISVIPSQSSSADEKASSKTELNDVLIFGALIVGAVILIPQIYKTSASVIKKDKK